MKVNRNEFENWAFGIVGLFAITLSLFFSVPAYAQELSVHSLPGSMDITGFQTINNQVYYSIDYQGKNWGWIEVKRTKSYLTLDVTYSLYNNQNQLQLTWILSSHSGYLWDIFRAFTADVFSKYALIKNNSIVGVIKSISTMLGPEEYLLEYGHQKIILQEFGLKHERATPWSSRAYDADTKIKFATLDTAPVTHTISWEKENEAKFFQAIGAPEGVNPIVMKTTHYLLAIPDPKRVEETIDPAALIISMVASGRAGLIGTFNGLILKY